MGVDVAVCAPHDAAPEALLRVLGGTTPFVLVHRPGMEVPALAREALSAALDAPMAATASPVPSAHAAAVVSVPQDPRLPPPPSVSAPCLDVCLLSRSALASIPLPAAGSDWASTLAAIAARLGAAGWRHVVAPGVGWNWSPADEPVNGAANEGLATHRLWTDTRLRPLRVAVDGACLTADPHNGSQAVVWNVALALQRVRPDASVHLAVPEAQLPHLRELAEGSGVLVEPRRVPATPFDAVYRPYQPLDPGELDWLVASGQRFVTSQLDMIAFSNSAYHPSAALFHAVRNLQRRAMRLADGVTFISEFGLQTALAECPDLDPARLAVVLCGADAEPVSDRQPSDEVTALLTGRFVACTSATFWHKNRQHAIRVFAALCRDHGYDGSLVIAGPEPYYGDSTDEELALIESLDPHIGRRVLRVGLVGAGTKWWLLEHADAVLYPSVVEGFGLVPFEAALVGTPCLASAGSAIGEVLAGSAALVPDWDVARWAAAAARVIASSDASTGLTADVRERARQLTWDATATRTWDAIDDALARPRAHRHVEEGGVASRVGGTTSPLAAGARLTHFVNRAGSYARRRMRR